MPHSLFLFCAHSVVKPSRPIISPRTSVHCAWKGRSPLISVASDSLRTCDTSRAAERGGTVPYPSIECPHPLCTPLSTLRNWDPVHLRFSWQRWLTAMRHGLPLRDVGLWLESSCPAMSPFPRLSEVADWLLVTRGMWMEIHFALLGWGG